LQVRTSYQHALAFEQDRERGRAVHRYDRVKRFEWVLYQILGYRGELPDEVVELCTGCDLRSTHIWASIQAILKRNGLRRYYNRIGQIIWRIVRLKYSVWVNPNKLGFTLKRLIGC